MAAPPLLESASALASGDDSDTEEESKGEPVEEEEDVPVWARRWFAGGLSHEELSDIAPFWFNRVVSDIVGTRWNDHGPQPMNPPPLSVAVAESDAIPRDMKVRKKIRKRIAPGVVAPMRHEIPSEYRAAHAKRAAAYLRGPGLKTISLGLRELYCVAAYLQAVLETTSPPLPMVRELAIEVTRMTLDSTGDMMMVMQAFIKTVAMGRSDVAHDARSALTPALINAMKEQR